MEKTKNKKKKNGRTDFVFKFVLSFMYGDILEGYYGGWWLT